MRFVIGLLLGFGIGLAGAILFAPEKRRRAGETAAGEDATGDTAFAENHDSMAGLRHALDGIRRQLQEAWSEARQAADEAEREMTARYERSVSKEKG